MMVVAEAMMGVTAFKAAMDISKGIKDIDDRARRNEAVIELQGKILSAQSAQAALIQSVKDLEEEVAGLKAWDADKQRYQLTEAGPGIFTYSLKEGVENGEPAHQMCTSCYQHGFKSILAAATWNPGMARVLICNDCGWYAYLVGDADPQHKDQRPRPYRGT
jgi:hypothetical protein